MSDRDFEREFRACHTASGSLELNVHVLLSLLVLESQSVKPVELLACFLFAHMHLRTFDFFFFHYRLPFHLLARFMNNA